MTESGERWLAYFVGCWLISFIPVEIVGAFLLPVGILVVWDWNAIEEEHEKRLLDIELEQALSELREGRK